MICDNHMIYTARFSSVFGAHHRAMAAHFTGRTRCPSPLLSADHLDPSAPALQSRPFAHVHRKCKN